MPVGHRFLCAVSLIPGLAIASGQGLPEGLYTIRNVNSGLYLDVKDGSSENAANVVQFNTPEAAHSQWHLRQVDRADSSLAYTVQNAQSDMFLSTPFAASSFDGANAFVWSSSEVDEALWTLHGLANGEGTTFSVKNVQLQRFLSVSGASNLTGANVHLWSSPGYPESEWQFQSQGSCHDAVVGDFCHNDTVWAKEYAIFTRPEWYPGLTNTSSFADFQAHMHYCFWDRCPMPCTSTTLRRCELVGRFWEGAEECEDAAPGSNCSMQVTWAMEHGIYDRPEWYPSLTEHSSFQEFQARLFRGQQAGEKTHCKEPCCHDALPGERCHEDATWAMLYGVNLPEVRHWYPPSLTNESSFAEFQAYLHLCYSDRCPVPCTPTEILSLPHDASMDCHRANSTA